MMWIVAVGLIAVACADYGTEEEQAEITGTAMYRERIMLPPNAVFEATLEDVSRADAPATVLGTATVEGAGPYEFAIAYDASQIDERMSYAVRGKVTVDGQLMFTTDTTNPVLTRGAGNTVDLMLKRVARSTGGDDGGAALEGTYWKLTEVGGGTFELGEHALEPHLALDGGQASGAGDCNQFSGGYELDGNKLAFGQLAMTMKACFEGMEVDSKLSTALGNTESFAIEGNSLMLMDPGGTVVATFEAGEAPAASE